MHRLPVLLLTALAWAATPAAAQGALDDSAAWEPLGDARQQARAFAFSGDPAAPTLWNGDSGIYRLDQIDGTWERVDLWPQGGPVLFLNDPFDDAGPDTLFVGSPLRRSVDGGQTFDRVQSPVENRGVSSKGALSRFPPGSPYPDRLVAGESPAPVYSDDGGDTWTLAESSHFLQTFRLHAFRSGRVVAGGFYGAVASDDGGQTYVPVPALYDTTAVRFDLTEMAMLDGFVTGAPGDSDEGRLLIVGTEAGRSGTHVWASDDEGRTWAEVHAFENGSAHPVAAVPSAAGGGAGWAVAADGLPGRVWATTDGGETWAEIGRVPGVGETAPGSFTRVIVVEVGPDGRLYAGTGRTGNLSSWSYRSRGRVADAMRPVAEEDGPAGPASVGVSVWPNPAGGAVTVGLSLASPGVVRVSVVDALGREVAVVHDGPASTGQRFGVDTEDWPAGAYTVRVEAEAGQASAGLTVVR